MSNTPANFWTRRAQDLTVDMVVQPTGGAGTHADKAAGLWALESEMPLLGMSTRAPHADQKAVVHGLAESTSVELDLEMRLSEARVVATCDHVSDGDALPTDGMRDAVLMLSRLEGLLFDPVSSGKSHGRIDRPDTPGFI